MAVTLCDYLVKDGIGQNCTDPSFGGLERMGVIINKADIDLSKVEYDPSQKNILTALPLKMGKKAYGLYQPANNPFNGSNKAFAAGTYSNTFTKQVKAIVLDTNPGVSANVIDPLANGEFVVILENKYKNMKAVKAGWNAFEIFGLETGLKQSEGTISLSGDDSEGGWAITLQETKAPSSALYLFATSYDATKTLIEGMVAGE